MVLSDTFSADDLITSDTVHFTELTSVCETLHIIQNIEGRGLGP